MDAFIHYNAILSSLPGNNIWATPHPYKLNFLNTGIILSLRAFFVPVTLTLLCIGGLWRKKVRSVLSSYH